MKFINFYFIFVVHFCPPGSGSGLRIRIRIRIQGPHWIRIQSGSGSTTLAMGIEKNNNGCSRAIELKVQNPRVVDWRIFWAPEWRPSGRRRWREHRQCRPPPRWRPPAGPSWWGSPVHQVEKHLKEKLKVEKKYPSATRSWPMTIPCEDSGFWA